MMVPWFPHLQAHGLAQGIHSSPGVRVPGNGAGVLEGRKHTYSLAAQRWQWAHTGLGALGLSREGEDWEKKLEGLLGKVTSEWGAQ